MTDCHAAVQLIRQKLTRARTALKRGDLERLALELSLAETATKDALTLFPAQADET